MRLPSSSGAVISLRHISVVKYNILRERARERSRLDSKLKSWKSLFQYISFGSEYVLCCPTSNMSMLGKINSFHNNTTTIAAALDTP